MTAVEKEFLSFISKFDSKPFKITIGEEEHIIGTGEPVFSVKVNKIPSIKDLLISTSLALGEAYMNKDIEIEGDLYTALYNFLGQMDRFSTDKKSLKKLIFTSLSKKNQQKEVFSHYDIGNDFYKLWLDETMSYSCG
ncbi:MAG: class I SAM-dependent methyltransferase, partial [Clostridiales bacterium]|nr:class I SAM-dependent methyltransferase [Clostridiales bacterium]